MFSLPATRHFSAPFHSFIGFCSFLLLYFEGNMTLLPQVRHGVKQTAGKSVAYYHTFVQGF